MKTVVLVVLAEFLLVVAVLGWQAGESYWHNNDLIEDMQASTVQNRARAGGNAFPTEEELREGVLEKAKEHGIALSPDQVTVHETMIAGKYGDDGSLEPGILDISLEADYDAPVKLIATVYTMHLTAAASHRAAVIVK